jgi:hypothetical protein
VTTPISKLGGKGPIKALLGLTTTTTLHVAKTKAKIAMLNPSARLGAMSLISYTSNGR